MERLDNHERLIVDTETTGLNVWQDDVICGVAVGEPQAGGKDFYFPFRHEQGPNLNPQQFKHLRRLLKSKLWSGWNLKFDAEMFTKEGMGLPRKYEDLMLAGHLLNENEYNFKLKVLAKDYVDPQADRREGELLSKLADLGLGKGDMWRLHPRDVAPYATDDCRLTRMMRSIYVPALRDWSLADIWLEVNDYSLATARMEMRGLKLDIPLIKKYIKEAERNIAPARAKVNESAGYEINLQSSKQLQAWLGIPSTRKEILDEIEDNEAVDALLTFRAWEKAISSYYRPYLEKMDADGILHPNIKLHGTISGRPSAENPNLQAVPRYSHIYKVKDVLVARPGYVLVSCDYSQAELRLGAHHTQDPVLIKILLSGADIHQATADETGLIRDDAKRINFGVFYGLGARGLARKLKISEKKAKRFLDAYHARFRNIRPLYRYMQLQAGYLGYIRLWTGRVRHYNAGKRSPNHKALSNLIQGGVAEIMRHAILKLDRVLPDIGSYLLLQVHDQCLFEVPVSEVRRAVPIIKATMEDFDNFLVPPKIDVKVGDRWGSAKDWQPGRKAA